MGNSASFSSHGSSVECGIELRDISLLELSRCQECRALESLAKQSADCADFHRAIGLFERLLSIAEDNQDFQHVQTAYGYLSTLYPMLGILQIKIPMLYVFLFLH